jgi:prepilin-type N-terminal cleavage/methylation domain-containing protein
VKKAFTLLELIFVIVVIGILAAAVIPSTKSDRAHDAALQLVSHIRYTQHLAMIDDKFDANDNVWYKKRWQITFNNGDDTNNKWSYTIFSDTAGSSTGSPDKTEVAINPLNPSKKLTGGFNGTGFIHTGDDEATAEMNLGEKYGINDVVFSPSCKFYGSTKIAFDHLGRPLKGAFENYSSAYPTSSRIIQSQCVITLVSSESNASIAIEPETGYAHIL